MNISYNDALKVLNAAKLKSLEINIPVSIVVVNSGGHLVSLASMDCVYGLTDFAIKKAKTAVMFGVDSEVMGSIVEGANIHAYGMINSNGGLLTIAGGVVLKNMEGDIIGAIASSGGTPQQDKEIASAGASVLSDNI